MNCHICNGPTEHFVDGKRDIRYYHCKPCGYIFKDPLYYQTIEEQKFRYDLHDNSENSEGYKAYFQRFLDFVIPHIEKPETALDFGCGRSTLLASLLKNESIICDAYDPIYHPDTLKSDKSYNLIVSTEVFEHLHQPRKVFSLLTKYLKDGGYMALQTQFHSNDAAQFRMWYYHQDPTHIVFFTPQTFKVLAKMYGYAYIADNGKNMVILKKISKESTVR